MVETIRAAPDPERGVREWNEILSALAHHWRRFVVRSLLAEGGRQSRADIAAALADWLAARTGETPRIETVQSQLYHVHLPKLESVELVTHDRATETVGLARNAALATPILTQLDEDEAALTA